MAKKNLAWMNVDPESLKGDKEFDAFIAAQELADSKLDTFKTAFIAKARKKGAIAADETLVINYRYGKLGVAKDKLNGGGTFKI